MSAIATKTAEGPVVRHRKSVKKAPANKMLQECRAGLELQQAFDPHALFFGLVLLQATNDVRRPVSG